MAWRFKVSKYKNAAPTVPKKEDWVNDIKVGSPQSCGNHVKASATFVAFNVENRGGGSLGLVPLDYKGRLEASAPLIHAHSDLITDFDFSPYDDGMLVTCSTDANVRIWHIPANGLSQSLSTPEYSLPQFDKRVENVTFHPSAEFLLTVAAFDTVKLWDILHQRQVYGYSGHEDQVQGTSWHQHGTLLVTSAKDRTIRIIDPRQDTVALQAEGHRSPRDSRVVWLGATDRILSTGWDASRVREVRLRDLRAFNNPYKVQSFDSSTGVLMPLYDPDTNMLVLAGKADVSIMYWEIIDREPYLTEGLKHNGQVQTKGACLVPKRGLEVMSGEVNRVLQLTSNAIIPITYQVPRKTYREFHSDLFPDTPGYDPALTIGEWEAGTTLPRPTVSLNPAKRSTPRLHIHRGPLSQRVETRTGGVGGGSGGVDAPVPAPRSRISNGTESPAPRPVSQVRPTPAKPMVAVKPSMAPMRPGLTPKPAARSSFPLQENKNLTNEDDLTQDMPLKNNNLAQLRKNFESAKETGSGVVGSPGVVEDSRKPRGVSISELCRNYETPAKDNKEGEKCTKEEGSGGVGAGVEESASKLSSLRKQFENRSMSLDERRKDSPGGGKEDEEKENVGDQMDIGSSGSGGGFGSGGWERRRVTMEQRSMTTVEESPGSPPTPRRPTLSRSFRRVCKLRHLKGTPGHKNSFIENLRDHSHTTPSESDGITANSQLVCLPLSGAGGRLTVLPHMRPGRLADGVIPALLNTANVMDFAFDPFNTLTLAVGCDDGKINLWHIPEAGLSAPTNQPAETFSDIGASEKVTSVRYHPLAAGVLAALTGDHTVKIWDLHSQSVPLTLPPHPDQIFSASWSPCGRHLATLCRDGLIRTFDPRQPAGALATGGGSGGGGGAGGRGGRVLWTLGGKFLVTVGFTKGSERTISVYRVSELGAGGGSGGGGVGSVGVDISPAMLIPHYDADTNTLFATGKGDSTIYAYEVGSDSPHLFPLSHHKCPTVHQGLAMLPKTVCDVRMVEFCKMLRLTSSTLEPLSFTVPRVKTELFQDDLFPPTTITWEPTMTAAEWLGGTNRPPRTMSLRPPDMTTLSESRGQASPQGPGDGSGQRAAHHVRQETPPFLKGVVPSDVRQTQHKLEESMSQQLTEVASTLEQDKMEGVDSAEWED